MPSTATSGMTPPFGGLSPSLGQVAYVLLNRLPLGKGPKSLPRLALHTLGTPLAFVLSQDQTLHQNRIPPRAFPLSARKGMRVLRLRVSALRLTSRRERRSPNRGADLGTSVPHSSHCSVFKDPRRPEDTKTLTRSRWTWWSGTTPLGFPRARRVGLDRRQCRHYSRH